MSLDVSPELLAQAESGPVDPDAFLAAVRESLPYAYAMVERLAGDLATGGTANSANPANSAGAADAGARSFVDNVVPPPSEAERGQLLRALASNAIRGSLERRFGVTLAFQNCHRLAVFPSGSAGTDAYRIFTSERAQLLNQSPELRDC
jgi:hypothetical protein